MIPREILKKTRQTKIGTTRIVTTTLAGFSFQPAAKPGGFSCAVKNSDHDDITRLDAEMDVVFVKRFNPGFANRPSAEWKSFQIVQNAPDGGVDFDLKPVAQPRFALIIPFDGILKFKPRFRVEDYLAAHFRFLSLSGSSAQTCSQGMPLSGLRHTRSARRSNSSICSGDKPSSISPNSSKIWPATSRRSFSGKRRICSRISVALMQTRLPKIQTHCKFPTVMNEIERHFLARRRFLISAETPSIVVPRPGLFNASSARRSNSAACSGVRSGSTHPSSSPYSQPKRCRISALTCSKGMPSLGFFSNSASRRSSSAINSGDSSGSRSSKRASAISRRSSGRNSRALAKISVALMQRSLPETGTSGKFAIAMRKAHFPP